ncbi:hypothetical protein D3C72_1547450 [compost metagenome]
MQNIWSTGDAHCSCRFITQFGQNIQLGCNFINTTPYRQQQSLSRRCRRYAAGGSRQKANLHTLFKCGNRLANSGLSDAQLCSGAGKTAFTGDGDKIKKVVQVAFHQVQPSLISITYKVIKYSLASNDAPCV